MPAIPDDERTLDDDFETIYAVVRQIPRGRVMGYGQVGARCGAGPRTVGRAMSFTPDTVPWWRVVGADGYLRIARRSPELRRLQRERLEAEGVRLTDSDIVQAEFFVDE